MEPRLNDFQRAERDRIAAKIRSGEYRMVAAACPSCGSTDFESLADRDRYGLDYALVGCRQCGLVQVSPRLAPASLADFYQSHYRRLYTGSDDPVPGAAGPAFERGRLALDIVTAHRALRSGRRVVEIGCGAGDQLRPFDLAGFETTGYDLDDTFLDAGRATGLDLRHGALDRLVTDVRAGDERPAAVMYLHTFEHLFDPVVELEQLAEVLADDGVLFLEVPGLRSVFRAREHFHDEYFEIAHTFHFDSTSLRRLLEANGWTCLQSDEHVRALYAPPRAEAAALGPALGSIDTSEDARQALALADDGIDDVESLLDVLRGSGMRPSQVCFEVGRRLHDEGRSEEAVELLRTAHRLWPDRGRYAYQLGLALAAGESDTAETVEALRTAAGLMVDAAFPQHHLGLALQRAGRHEQAVGAHGRAVELRPEVAIFRYHLGHAHFSLRNWHRARACFAEALERDPSLAWAAHSEGLCWFQLGEFDRAIAAHERAMALRDEAAFVHRRDEARSALAARQEPEPQPAPSGLVVTLRRLGGRLRRRIGQSG